MRLPEHLGEAKPLSHFLERLRKLPPGCWLYVPQTTRDVTLALQGYPQTIDSHELSEDAIDAFEESVASSGLKCFLSPGQIGDIMEALRLHRAAFTTDELVAAIDFFWRHDAFIQPTSGDVA